MLEIGEREGGGEHLASEKRAGPEDPHPQALAIEFW